MGLFSATNSWGFDARGQGGFFHPEKRCPNVDDCSVKLFLGSRRAPARTASEPPSWPHKGSWQPAGGRQQAGGA